jgi:hypothetical protein
VTSYDRVTALERIRANIERHGYHIYVVAGGPDPAFAYTIGLTATHGAEIVFAGGAAMTSTTVDDVVAELAKTPRDGWSGLSLSAVDGFGVASVRPVDATWSKLLLLGAYDYYDVDAVETWQIVPDGDHRTLDVPAMDRPWDSSAEPAWRWLVEPWEYDVPATSTAVTNVDSLRGAVVTEVTRWEEDYWEMFAGPGPDVAQDDARTVSLGTLLAIDPTLEIATTLAVPGAVRRDPDDRSWRVWRIK